LAIYPGISDALYEVLPGMAAGFLVYGVSRMWSHEPSETNGKQEKQTTSYPVKYETQKRNKTPGITQKKLHGVF